MTATTLNGQTLSAHVWQPLLIEQLTAKVSSSHRKEYGTLSLPSPIHRRNMTTTSLVVRMTAIIVLMHIALGHSATLDIYKNARLGHRIVQTRYGRLHGLILPLDNFRFLRAVEVFLGVPYATPPTKQNR